MSEGEVSTAFILTTTSLAMPFAHVKIEEPSQHTYISSKRHLMRPLESCVKEQRSSDSRTMCPKCNTIPRFCPFVQTHSFTLPRQKIQMLVLFENTCPSRRHGQASPYFTSTHATSFRKPHLQRLRVALSPCVRSDIWHRRHEPPPQRQQIVDTVRAPLPLLQRFYRKVCGKLHPLQVPIHPHQLRQLQQQQQQQAARFMAQDRGVSIGTCEK